MRDDFARRGPLSVTPVTEGRTPGEESLTGPPGSTETAGPTVPRFQILGLAGIGGMGVVYRAEDARLGRTVALKFLPPTLTPNPRAKMRFLNEARAASALDHPNICTIYEIGETAEGQLYLAMAYYEGETLKQRLERGSLPAAEALHIALQVTGGLAKAHRHGIVHRDIKPANLMLNSDGIVKILDFGIARLPDQTLPGPPLGTPGYMSPEQARTGEVDARSDVWSLGVVLREMLTGWRPGRSGHADAPPGEKEPPGPLLPQEAPPGMESLLSRMLAEDPADRYPDAAALLPDLSALERAAAGTEGAPGPDPARRRPPVWAIVLTVVAAALAVAAWLLLSARRPGGTAPDPSQATVTRLTDLPGKEWFPSLSSDGHFFVYARKIGDRSRLFLQQVGGGTALDLLPDSQAGDSQPAVSPDGHQIAFRSEREGGGIFVMGLMGESVRRVTDSGFNPAWSPDGAEILYATEGIDNPRTRRYPSEIYRVNLATENRRLVLKGDAVQPSWSPHGFRIAYWGRSSSGQRVVWTVPAGGGEAVQATEGTSIDWNPVWSPDGRSLYFVSDRSGITNLWRLPIDERSGRVRGKPEPVTTSGQAAMLLSLARDGRHIAYASDETRTVLEKVAFAPASGATAGPAATITETPNMIATLDASRDGRWLVYQTSLPQEDLFVIHPDGSGLRRLTQDDFKDRQPRWSPDGTRIAFYSNRGGKYEIWTLRADGSQLERAAVIPGRQAFHPIWSPDGRQLACDLDENEALIDLTRPVAERRALLLPPPGQAMGFSASSWSADGRWLAGNLHQPDGQQVPGIVLYSLAGRRYVRLTDRGDSATWLSDRRHLLYWDRNDLLLLDTLGRAARQVLTTSPGSGYNDLCLSPDDRTLYLARNTEQGDIWLLTMK
jgi:Tol biopolymer transport system component